MVQTRAAARLIEIGQAHEYGVQPHARPFQSSSSSKPPQPAKRHRRQKPTGELCRLNLDVLFLIAAYVTPIDLLNLARTCKSLRELLIDRASQFVWRTARRQVKGLPDCPPDLTEPEYANLVFYTRCHGCGKHAKTILWNIRRRYCPNCRLERLCPIDKCDTIIKSRHTLPMEHLQIGNETTMWVDKEQVESFMAKYNLSCDKARLLSDMKDQHDAISLHVGECLGWEKMLASERRYGLDMRRWERRNRIFELLEQHGFQPEIDYFGSYAIRKSNNSLFGTSKPLTDKEWAQVWPAWVKTLNDFRLRRLDQMVYRPRRVLLESEYREYMARPLRNMPSLPCLPNLQELARLSPFQDIIKAPEGTCMGENPFESAFAQLPNLINEWRERIASELAELVQIPNCLSFERPSKGKGRLRISGDTIPMGPSHAVTRKLNLASAVFVTDIISTYPEVLHTMHPPVGLIQGDHTLSIRERFQIKFFEEAPYIVHTCGLDPNVATVEDMDKRNARLRCLRCGSSDAYNWREALSHAHSYHDGLSEPARWQVEEQVDAVSKQSVESELWLSRTRCLLCRPQVGDASFQIMTRVHLELHHGLNGNEIIPGVHYAPVGLHASWWWEWALSDL